MFLVFSVNMKYIYFFFSEVNSKVVLNHNSLVGRYENKTYVLVKQAAGIS